MTADRARPDSGSGGVGLDGVPNHAGCAIDTGLRWYVVHSQPGRELLARTQLRQQDFDAFLPLCHKTIRHARKLRTVTAPFFPRYLFVRMDIDAQRWRSVNGTLGVSNLIMQGDQPSPVPHGVVENLAALAQASGLMQFDRDLKVGQDVRFLAGPLADLIGTLQNVGEGSRIRVLLDVMGRQTSIWSSADKVAPIA